MDYRAVALGPPRDGHSSWFTWIRTQPHPHSTRSTGTRLVAAAPKPSQRTQTRLTVHEALFSARMWTIQAHVCALPVARVRVQVRVRVQGQLMGCTI